MIKTSTRLADGRELIYFDASPQPGRDDPDRRELPRAGARSELRYDPFQDAWVMYASHRQDRTHLPAADDCPLCPSRPGHPTEIPAAGYQVAVFENRFPSLTGCDGRESALATDDGQPGEAGPFTRRTAAGRCEVVCYTDEHEASFAEFT